jgi:acyl-CoA hydrolase
MYKKVMPQVTWVGRSSMEVLISVSAGDPEVGGTHNWQHVGSAMFVMVMRDAEGSRAVPVPALLPVTVQQRLQYDLGGKHSAERKMVRCKDGLCCFNSMNCFVHL